MKPVRAKPLRGKLIGLAIGERSLFAAEIHADPHHVEARQLAEFIYPAALSFDAPEMLGKALGIFLREHHFTAHAAVLGLPAKWLMVRSKQVPPAQDAVIADLLRFQSEQEFSADMDLVFDYAAEQARSAAPSSHETSSRAVLLMATPRRQVDAVLKMSQAAELKVRSITSSSAALALVTLSRETSAIPGNSRLVLYLDRSAAELTMQRGSAPSLLKHLRFERGSGAADQAINAGGDRAAEGAEPPALAWLSPPANGASRGDGFSNFVGDLRRAVALLPGDVSGFGASAGQRELALWDSSGLDAEELAKLQEAVGFPVRGEGLASIGVIASNGHAAGEGDRYGAATALAICGLQEELPVDFLHSRLAPPKKSRFGSATVWGAAGAAALIVLIIVLYLYTRGLQSDADISRKQFSDLQPQLKAAMQLKDKVDHASNWYSGQTPITNCLMELTRLFPDSEQSWATQFEMARSTDSQAFTGKLLGKTSRRAPLALPDSLNKDSHFSQVYMSTSEVPADSREGRGMPQENFELVFVYDDQPSPGNHAAAAKPAPKLPAMGAPAGHGAQTPTAGGRSISSR